jgi:CSLREA domain-containing protein
MSNILFRLFSVCSILAALLAAPGARPAYAAGYVVNSLADNTSNDSQCTLREAIQEANNGTDTDCPGSPSNANDTITFSVSGTITLSSPLPAIVSGQGALTIDGGGSITVSGNNLVQVMVVNSGADLTLRNITIANGSSGGGGGGIFNAGTLTVTNSTFSNNSVGFSSSGGGIFNASGGTLTVTNSTFSNNSVFGGFGGGIYNAGGGTLTVTNSTFSGNSAIGGGGIFNTGTLTLKNTIIANSTSGGDCINAGTVTTDSINNLIEGTGANACGLTSTSGNIIGSDPNLGALTGSPAYYPLNVGSPAIDAGDNTTCAAMPVNNQSQNGVTRPKDGDNNGTPICDIGAYERTLQPAAYVVNTLNDNVTAGDGQCTLREAILAANNDSAYNSLSGCGAASSLDDTITFSVSGTITLSSTLPAIVSGQGALTIDGGGGITVSGNNSVRVMVVNSGADLTLRNITIANGRITGVGGGIFNNGGTLTVTNSTFSNNSAIGPGGGGGILNAGTLTVTNSTFSANSADDGGGGIRNAGTLTVTNSTFSNNSAIFGGGGIYNETYGTLTLKNTIIANSTSGGDCINAGTVDTANSINNLIKDTGANACGLTNGTNGNIIGSDPDLGALTGSPAYYPLNVGSPAIDAGDNATCAAAPVNNQSQNGVTRPVDGDMNGVAVCDIGAYERPLVKVYLPLIAR